MGQRTFRTAACRTVAWLAGVISVTGTGSVALAEDLASLPADQLDWVAWGNDRPAGEVCQGRYVMPGYLLPPADQQGHVRGQSDSASYGAGGQTQLDGSVILRQGDQQLQASQATLTDDRRRVDLQGPIIYRQPGVLLRGDEGAFGLASPAASVGHAYFVFHQARLRGNAQRLERLDDGQYQIQSGAFTTCEPQSRLWTLSGHRIVINRAAGFGTATHSTLRFYDVPVFYWPWVRFPIDERRLTGMLYPSVGYSSTSGFDYMQPVYLNLAPNYDATLFPRYMARRGLALGGQFRYLFNSDRGTLEGNYLNRDQGGARNDRSYDLLRKQKRWYINAQHDGALSPRTTYQLRYGAASDGHYFDDFGTTFAEQDTDNLERRAQIDYQGEVWILQARARGYQVMDFPVKDKDKPFYELPSLSANASWHQTSGTYQEWNSNVTDFTRDVHWNNSDILATKAVTGTRLNVAPAIGYRRSPSWGYFEPRAQLYLTQYQLDWKKDTAGPGDTPPSNRGWDTSPSRAVPVLSVDSGLVFERPTVLFGSRWRQTLEPRLYYAYVPYRRQDHLPTFDTDYLSPSWSQLWSPFRFNGIDRIGDVNKLSYGVTSRFLEDATGRERFSASVGQSRYFESRKVTDDDSSKGFQDRRGGYWYMNHRKNSSAVGQLSWTIDDHYRLRYGNFFDTERGHTERNEVYLHYQHPAGRLFNLGYRWQVQNFDPSGDQSDRLGYNREEYDASFGVKMKGPLSMVGRYLYDHTNNRSLEALAGIQYNDCCYGVEVAWRVFRDDNGTANNIQDDQLKRGLFLRFILKGLGGVGNKPETYYQQAIEGYDPVLFQ